MAHHFHITIYGWKLYSYFWKFSGTLNDASLSHSLPLFCCISPSLFFFPWQPLVRLTPPSTYRFLPPLIFVCILFPFSLFLFPSWTVCPRPFMLFSSYVFHISPSTIVSPFPRRLPSPFLCFIFFFPVSSFTCHVFSSSSLPHVSLFYSSRLSHPFLRDLFWYNIVR